MKNPNFTSTLSEQNFNVHAFVSTLRSTFLISADLTEISPELYVNDPELKYFDPYKDYPVYYFNRIFVPDLIQDEGYGTALLKQVLAGADANKFCILCDANSYTPEIFSNSELEKFYQKYGFVSIADRRLVYVPNIIKEEVKMKLTT